MQVIYIGGISVCSLNQLIRTSITLISGLDSGIGSSKPMWASTIFPSRLGSRPQLSEVGSSSTSEMQSHIRTG